MARRSTEPSAPVDADAARIAILATIARIPAGRVSTYGQIAWIAGYPGRARLVGRVLGGMLEAGAATPWHRVINAAGQISLPKFSEEHREQKRRLGAEGVRFENDRVSLRRYGWQAGGDSPLIDP
ncbi:MGMT family protein [Nevskia ramosa]|uniref:MGMT family protein n=1 Tax=Nevskia ramosa TaxID=64002 RepID=UPI0003B4DD55|nr:MGMT family protein [Nevskia ramosa]